MKGFLEGSSELRVNREKSAVDANLGTQLLGFTGVGPGRRRVSDKALKALRSGEAEDAPYRGVSFRK